MKLYNQAHIIKSLGINYFHPDFNDLTDEIVKSYLDNKVGLNVWTVNEIEDMKVCLSWDIDGLITNFPDRAISIAR